MANSSVDQFEVKGKVALVTGAASGIGLAITKCLLEKGAKVSMVDINEAEGLKWLTSLRDEYSADIVSFTQVDVSVTKQLADVFVKTKESFGGLDIVCNNAAIVSGEAEVRWRKMFEVNLFAIIESISLAIEHMSTAKGGKGGVVINTSSIVGIIPLSSIYPKYSAAKTAIVGYTRVHKKIAQTDGIRVNCICPGTVDTPPVRKQLAAQPPLFEKKTFDYIKTHMLSPERVAEGVLHLITDTSKAGEVMAITFENGFTFPKLLDVGDMYPELVGQEM